MTRRPTLCSRCGLALGALLSLEQAATCLNVPLKTIHYWFYTMRKFPRHHVGKFARVLHADLDVMVRHDDERSA